MIQEKQWAEMSAQHPGFFKMASFQCLFADIHIETPFCRLCLCLVPVFWYAETKFAGAFGVVYKGFKRDGQAWLDETVEDWEM